MVRKMEVEEQRVGQDEHERFFLPDAIICLVHLQDMFKYSRIQI